jgi:1-acyl-sn-glycerol-3-phosphate acyltransferase
MASGGLRSAFADLAGALVPLSAREAEDDLRERLRQVPNRLNEYGFDGYGLSPEWISRLALPGVLLYRFYFRARTHDIDRVPPGRVLVIGNHAGQLPFDGLMLSTALLLEARPPRIPGVGVLAARSGALVGTPENCRHMLENEECVVVFPEGARGMNKLYRDRYVLQRFGLGFMRLALETSTPIVPVGIVGSEEQQPGFANLEGLSRALDIPAFPITLGFPWLGPLGLAPLPVRYHLYFGEPLHFEGSPTDEDALIESKVEQVKSAISALLERGLREREGVFR